MRICTSAPALTRMMMRALVSGLIALLAAMGSTGLAEARPRSRPSTRPSTRQPVVVPGLRPTLDAGRKRLDTKRLPEAQRLRTIVEEISREIMKRTVINHAALSALAGPSYMTAYFRCKSEPRCVVRLFRKLRMRARWLVYGDYVVVKSTYWIRLRLIDLAPLTLTSETRFSLAPGDLENRAKWRRQLAILFMSVLEPDDVPIDVSSDEGSTRPAPSDETGPEEPGESDSSPEGRDSSETSPPDPAIAGAGKPGAGKPGSGRRTGGARVGAGEATEPPAEEGRPSDGSTDPTKPSGEIAGAEAEASPAPENGAGAAAGADELTDADFGEVATTSTSGALQLGQDDDDGPWLEAATTVAMSTRWFDFLSDPDNEVLRPPGYTSGWTARVGGSASVYPLAALDVGGRLVQRIGFQADYNRTDTSAAGGRETELYAGATYRLRVGPAGLRPTFNISAGYMRHDFVIIDRAVNFPSVSYRGGVVGAEVRVPLLTERAALKAGARSMFLLPRGEIFTDDQYGDSRVGGLDLVGGLEVRPLRFLSIGAYARYARFSLEFDGDGDLSSLGAVGAKDRSLSATVVAGIFL